VKGSLTLGLGAVSLLGGISQGPKWGWASTGVLVLFTVGIVSLVAFVRIQQRTSDPLIALEWLRIRNVTFPVLSQTFNNFSYMGGFILAPLVLGTGLGMERSTIGLLVIARPLTFSLTAPVAGLVTIRVGERVAGVVGALGVVLSMLCWATVDGSTSMWFIVVALALSGAGLGIASPAMTSLTANAVPQQDLGVVGAMQQLMSQLGSVVGTVVLTTISVDGAEGYLDPYHQAFFVAAAVAAVGMTMAWFARSTPRS